MGRTGPGRASRPVVFHEAARALLTPDVREMLDGVLTVVCDQARREGVALERVEAYATSACDEIERNLIVSVHTGLLAAPRVRPLGCPLGRRPGVALYSAQGAGRHCD